MNRKLQYNNKPSGRKEGMLPPDWLHQWYEHNLAQNRAQNTSTASTSAGVPKVVRVPIVVKAGKKPKGQVEHAKAKDKGKYLLPGKPLEIRQHESVSWQTLLGGFDLISVADNAAYNSATDHFFSYNFQLSSFPNVSELTSRFQAYCIKEVEFMVVPTRSVNTAYWNGTAVVTDTTPHVFIANDPTDDNVPASIGEIFQYSTTQIHVMSQTLAVKIKPMYQTAVYESGIATGYSPTTGWLSTADPNVPHYGIKMCMRTTGQCQRSYGVYFRAIVGLKAIQ